MAAKLIKKPQTAKVCGFFLIIKAGKASCKPYIHFACTTMVPGIIRDESDSDILGSEFAIRSDGGLLSLGGDGCHLESLVVTLCVLDAIALLQLELRLTGQQQRCVHDRQRLSD